MNNYSMALTDVKSTLYKYGHQYQYGSMKLVMLSKQCGQSCAKYYTVTDKPFAYVDAIILHPAKKLSLFKKDTWEPGFMRKI
jgi:hypothetical protein